MSSPDRFDIIVPLHEVAGWRRALAVDRGGVAPRAVVLSYPPSALTDDPTRLVGLMRDAEAAALVHHPNALPALGLETSGDLLVAVEAYRRGVPLRTLLDVARRLPPELAVRVAVDACAALAAVHGVDPGDGHLLVHGDVSPARLLVADDGSTLLCGTGTAGGGEPADDVRAVAAVLHECLLGAPPAPVPAPVDDPFMPQPLAEVLGRALGATPSAAPYATPEALADALAGALSPAPPEALAAYLEAILPAGEGERGELLRLVAHGLSRAAARAPGASEPARPVEAAPRAVAPGPGADLEPLPAAPAAASTPAPAAAPPAAAAPAREHALEVPCQALAAEAPVAPPASAQATGASAPGPGTAPATPGPGASAASVAALQPVAPRPPEPAAPRSGRRSRLVPAVAVAMALLGFGGGYLVSRSRAPASAAPPAAVAAAPAPAPAQPAPPAAAPPVEAPPVAAPPAPAPATSAEPAPAPAPRAASAASIEVSSEPPGEIYVDGKRVGRSPLTVPVSRGDHEVRLRSKYEGVDVRRRVTVRGPGTPVRFALRRGALKVTAPEDAEVFVDGRRVGKGDVKVELWEGDHVVEARLGEARVQERFTVGPGETWTYDVTPTE